MRRAKIVATIGPASDDPRTLRTLLELGVDVARLNFSHGDHEDHARTLERIRTAQKQHGRPVAVLQDLQGPKIRTGPLRAGKAGVRLVPGAELVITTEKEVEGDERLVSTTYPYLAQDVSPGDRLLLADGLLELRVLATDGVRVRAEVVQGGMLGESKGINLPGVALRAEALSDKDRADLAFGLSHGVDVVALSFVRTPEDVLGCRREMERSGRSVPIIAKIEKPEAIEQLDGILAAADGLMVARGDLGVEMPPQKVPTIQRQVLRACRKAGKPVIVATQMLESMIEAPTPTRAEASDVATAVYDGADAVMLSAESAAGRYPVEAVRIMSEIIAEVERDPHYRTATDAAHPEPEATVSDVICDALRRSAAILPMAALVTYTAAGRTALRAARERPAAPILSLTPDLATARRLALVWGTHAVHVQEFGRLSEIVDNACAIVTREGFARPGDTITVTGGMPFGISGGTNLLRIAQVPGGPARG
jgi:pyruvate kinase